MYILLESISILAAYIIWRIFGTDVLETIK